MKKSQSNKVVLFLTIAFLTFQFIPLLGLGSVNDKNSSLSQIKLSNSDLHNLDISNDVDLDKSSSDSISVNEISVFDDNLRNVLSDLQVNQKSNQKELKVIILFEETTSKKTRVQIIDSVFSDYRILGNYDIISGIYIKVRADELLLKGRTLEGIKEIKKIYKSERFENPYILDDTPQISALNKDLYDNWWVHAIGADNLVYDGTGVRVAIVDTGIFNHPELNIVENRNFVTDESPSNYDDGVGHGTHVAGIVGGDGSGSDGKYRGVAPGVSLINARAGNASGLLEGDIVNAIDWSSKPISSGGAGADIISMSFGGGLPYTSDVITQAISNAQQAYGVIFVASAGNSGPDYFTGSTPASGIDVISVAATDRDNKLASFSSWGPTFRNLLYPDVAAPGINIISAEAKGSTISYEERLIGDYFDFSGDADYIPLSGTSMSAPMVTGALAILKEAYPLITPETARIALLEGATKLPNGEDDDFLKSGVGIINVSASLDILNRITPDYNDTAKVFPDNLPIKPYDLLHFPGDHQKFNLTVISGKVNLYDIQIPSDIQGVSINTDKLTLNFAESGIKFLELDIEINKDAIPGMRDFQLNFTVGGHVYDTVEISFEIRLPEHHILMDSYHGLNDWFPTMSIYQMGFYEAMRDIADLNISIDYAMEYWTPDYNKSTNNSILTEERLASYDIVCLQTPILPYSPLEVTNLKNYFESGGSVLFLGTRYQDIIVDNVNDLLSKLNTGIQINEENVMNDNWLGLGTSVTAQDVQDLTNPIIFDNVNKFTWLYGNTFSVSGSAVSIATLESKTIAAMYNGTSQGKGRVLAFGDYHWISSQYKSEDNYQDHVNLLKNSIKFLLPNDVVSINIDLGAEQVQNPQIDLSIYMKSQKSDMPITPMNYSSLEVMVQNGGYSEKVIINNSLANYGIYLNNSFNLPTPSYDPYSFIVNLTIGPISYIESNKILYYDNTKMPEINSLTVDKTSITRATAQSIDLITELDSPLYGNFDGFLSIYSTAFSSVFFGQKLLNSKQSSNKTLSFSHFASNNYRNTFDPDTSDPSGYGLFYVIPSNENYTNPHSPRASFQIINNPPEFIKTSSTFSFGSNTVTFDETESDTGVYVYSTNQGVNFNFEVDVTDSVSYEDMNSDLRVFVNFFMASTTPEGYIIFIFPSTIIVSELNYQLTSNKHEGSFAIPYSMQYSSIEGTKSVSTAAPFDLNTNQGYLGLFYITVYDSEGQFDDFIIVLLISGGRGGIPTNLIWIFGIIAIVSFIGVSLIFIIRRRKKGRFPPVKPIYPQRYTQESISDQAEQQRFPESVSQPDTKFYCPFCGESLRTPKRFCPHCGESLQFDI
ncbi:MAG: S8 family serine peptidase [Promethearchaeota archaeon]